jgi:hypothetical protein
MIVRKPRHHCRERGRFYSADWVLLAAAALLFGGVSLAGDAATQRDGKARHASLLTLETPASSEEEFRPLAGRGYRPGGALDFYHGHLVPRVARQLGSINEKKRYSKPVGELQDPARVVRMGRSARRKLERATRTAVEDYLLETTTLDSRLVFFNERLPSVERQTSVSSTGRLRFRVGFEQIRPKLELRYKVNRSIVKLNFGTGGSVRLDFTRKGMKRTRVNADWDGDRYRLSCRFGF